MLKIPRTILAFSSINISNEKELKSFFLFCFIWMVFGRFVTHAIYYFFPEASEITVIVHAVLPFLTMLLFGLFFQIKEFA
ncbi:MAG: hypothetical protein ACI9XO_001652 [Paraglaciecola sp.]|jgi:hypothetical protein